MKVITIANQKGGVGKTTTAICIAQELIRRNYKVLFIDADAQANATIFYEGTMEDNYTLADIMYGDELALTCIQSTSKGDIICSDTQLKDAENKVKLDEYRFLHLKRALKGIEEKYDFIIIDTPPAIGVLLKNVLAASDFVIIPIQESGWSLTGIMDFRDAINMAKDTNNPSLSILGILPVMVHKNTLKSKNIHQLASSLADKLNTKVFSADIRETTKCAEALTMYFVPLHLFAPSANTTLDYANLVDEILADI